jgi:hypothetical protein
MGDGNVVTARETKSRHQESLISAFEEIAQTFLLTAPVEEEALQAYLDGSIEINGIRYRRRTVLLAIHDMKDELEAPAALQSKTLAQLVSLKVKPIPRLKSCRDVATAILRMEVVIRSLKPAVAEKQTDQTAPRLQPAAPVVSRPLQA